MAAKIREVARVNSVKLILSDGGAFETRAKGDLVHSKLGTGKWPDFDAIVTAIKKLK